MFLNYQTKTMNCTMIYKIVGQKIHFFLFVKKWIKIQK